MPRRALINRRAPAADILRHMWAHVHAAQFLDEIGGGPCTSASPVGPRPGCGKGRSIRSPPRPPRGPHHFPASSPTEAYDSNALRELIGVLAPVAVKSTRARRILSSEVKN